MTSYVSLPALKDRLDIISTDTADDRKIKRAVEAATRTINTMTGQRFQPATATRYLTTQYSDVVWLPYGLISLTTLATLTSDAGGTRVYGDSWASTDYDLWPYDATFDDEPYSAIRANAAGAFTFPSNRHGISVVGSWGWTLDTEAVGTLNGGIDASVTTLTMTAGHTVEALNTLLIGSEQLYVTAVATNSVTVQRARNGTTAASHLTAAAVLAYQYPDDITEATAIQALRLFRRSDAPFGIAGAPEVGQTAVIARVDPDVRLLVRDYRRMAVGAV